MKRTKTKLLRTLFVTALIMYGITFNEEVNARTITEDETNQICTEITQKIENKSKSVIENDFSNIKKITTYYSEEVGINSEELKNIAVGKPFMIYSLSDSKELEGIKQPDSGVLIILYNLIIVIIISIISRLVIVRSLNKMKVRDWLRGIV